MNVRTLRRAWRGIREHAGFTAVSAGVIACALLLVGFFVLVSSQVRAMVDNWESDAHVSAYFRLGTPEATRRQVQDEIVGRPEVAGVSYVSEDAARAWMVERSPELSGVLEGLGAETLPASLEITLRPEATADVAGFARILEAQGVWEDVDFGQDWVARFQNFLSLLSVMGTTLGVVVLLVTIFLVANTIHMVVHARRDEVEILRLVGADDAFIYGPFLVEGAVQGVVGSCLGLGALYAVHEGVLLRAHHLVAAATGGAALPFVTPPVLALLALGGLALGVGGAWTAVRRFLRQVA